MTAASDKARFFLEQSVPELKEFEKRGIFSAAEITSIARKRSDFEHKINAPGSSPTDYARYAEFEMNVDTLRRKRVKRLGIKSTAYNGKRRIFFVFDRGCRKHPGDLTLWMEAIEFAKKQKAYKKLLEMFTQVLRLHPTKPDLWIHAAHYAVEEHGDMTEARSYMQRALRFCKGSRTVWLQYGRLEMAYAAKIQARREILGINEGQSEEAREDDENILHLPKLTAMDVEPEGQGHEINTSALDALDETPAMTGAIPIAIFNSAMGHFNDPVFGLDYFTMLQDYGQVPTCRSVADHVEGSMMTRYPDNWCSLVCHVRLPVVGVSPLSPAFPTALRQVVARINQARKKTSNPELGRRICAWLETITRTEDLDPALKTVMESVIRRFGTSLAES
jgi:U3 small nucleolar RNA-associated protein 6